MPLFFQPGIPGGADHLDPDESRHAVKVLRLKSGDPISITDGKGRIYYAQILHPDLHKCIFKILETQQAPTKKSFRHIAIAPTKNADRIEWFVEKAVELGIDQISFFTGRNSERKVLNQDRVEKIAISAMKQSGQLWLPTLSPMIPLKEILKVNADQKFICYVDAVNPVNLQTCIRATGHCLILIGPEGDFSTEELNQAQTAGFQKVSLGASRLRTETAGIVACHLMNLANTE